MLELKQCFIRILDRAEQNAKEGQHSSQDEFDLNDCLKQIQRKLLEIQWANTNYLGSCSSYGESHYKMDKKK